MTCIHTAIDIGDIWDPRIPPKVPRGLKRAPKDSNQALGTVPREPNRAPRDFKQAPGTVSPPAEAWSSTRNSQKRFPLYFSGHLIAHVGPLCVQIECCFYDFSHQCLCTLSESIPTCSDSTKQRSCRSPKWIWCGK